jgi:hypothetical protein
MRNRIGRNRSRHSYCLGGPPALLHFFISTAESALARLPLWFLLGQRQSFLIRGPSLSCRRDLGGPGARQMTAFKSGKQLTAGDAPVDLHILAVEVVRHFIIPILDD